MTSENKTASVVGPNGVVYSDIPYATAFGLVDGGHAKFVTAEGGDPEPESDSGEESTTGPEQTDNTEPEQSSEPAKVAPEGAPRGNASREEFAAYAESLGIEVPEGATRDEIRALTIKE